MEEGLQGQVSSDEGGPNRGQVVVNLRAFHPVSTRFFPVRRRAGRAVFPIRKLDEPFDGFSGLPTDRRDHQLKGLSALMSDKQLHPVVLDRFQLGQRENSEKKVSLIVLPHDFNTSGGQGNFERLARTCAGVKLQAFFSVNAHAESPGAVESSAAFISSKRTSQRCDLSRAEGIWVKAVVRIVGRTPVDHENAGSRQEKKRCLYCPQILRSDLD